MVSNVINTNTYKRVVKHWTIHRLTDFSVVSPEHTLVWSLSRL